MDTQPNLHATGSRWLPAGAWRWIAAAIPVGAAIGVAAAALYGVGPVDPDTGADRDPPAVARTTDPPPTDVHTAKAPAPQPPPVRAPVITTRGSDDGSHPTTKVPRPTTAPGTTDPAATTSVEPSSSQGPPSGESDSPPPAGPPGCPEVPGDDQCGGELPPAGGGPESAAPVVGALVDAVGQALSGGVR